MIYFGFIYLQELSSQLHSQPIGSEIYVLQQH